MEHLLSPSSCCLSLCYSVFSFPSFVVYCFFRLIFFFYYLSVTLFSVYVFECQFGIFHLSLTAILMIYCLLDIQDLLRYVTLRNVPIPQNVSDFPNCVHMTSLNIKTCLVFKGDRHLFFYCSSNRVHLKDAQTRSYEAKISLFKRRQTTSM